MAGARFHDGFQLFLLGCWVGLGLLRLVGQYSRGVHVVAVDRQRTLAEGFRDLVALLCFTFWWYELAAYALPLRLHVVPDWLRTVVLEGGAFEWAGRILWLAAIAIYGLAMQQMGDSWRIGIDRMKPGALVTRGIFRYSRNPIYLSFDLGVLATFLCTGQLHFLIFFLVLTVLLHDQIAREERFLTAKYGPMYRDYCEQVRRYL